MSNQPVGDHHDWESLAAAHALHALDPDDEQSFRDHLQGCSTCATTLDGFALVAAQLGSLADSESDDPPAWTDIRASLPTRNPSTVTVLDLHRRRRHRARLALTAAAAVVTLSAGAVAAWDLSHGGATHTRQNVAALSACQHQPSCRIIRLHTPKGTNPAAVVVNTDRVTVVPLTMADPPTGHTYALWQLPRDGSPLLVAEFRDAAEQTASVPLPSEYADTAAFAVSVETTRIMPTRPTHLLAVGAAI